MLKQKSDKRHQIRPKEASFTLLETIFALGLMVSIILEVATVQGNAVTMSEYERKVTQATWIAKSIMAKVEYEWYARPFEELKVKLEEQEVEGQPEFKYSLEIKEWKLPLLDMISSLAGGGEEGAQSNPLAGMMKTAVSQFIGDDLLKTATVEVFWPEGVQRNSTAITYLLTNQRKLDELFLKLPPIQANPKEGEKPDTKGEKPSGGGTPAGNRQPSQGGEQMPDAGRPEGGEAPIE